MLRKRLLPPVPSDRYRPIEDLDMPQPDSAAEDSTLLPEALDPLLASVIRENQEKVAGWARGEPGCWGFLAGKAVAGYRRQVGRPLADNERRVVWNRLWWWLEQVKARSVC